MRSSSKKVLVERLEKFSLELEPEKTRLVEFGRFAQREAKEKGKSLETIYFLGFTHYCTRNRKGNFMVGRKIEKSRFRRKCSKFTGTDAGKSGTIPWKNNLRKSTKC